jgi:Fe-S cluster assembly protein SufD
MASAASMKDRHVSAGAVAQPAWLWPLRRRAIAHVADVGFPTTRDEAWRYTNLAPLAAASFPPADGAVRDADAPRSAALDRWALLDGHMRLVFVDGRYAPRLSSPGPGAGVHVRSLAEAMRTDDERLGRHLARHATWDANVFAALNTAFVSDGAFVDLPPETRSDRPIELMFLGATPGVATHPRVLILVGPHSRVTVIERYIGLAAGAYFTNTVTEVVVAGGASVEHHVVQEQDLEAFHIATVHAALDRDSAFSTCGVSLGARLARTTLSVRFGGEGGRAELGGLYAIGGAQHVDHHVTVEHAVPRCASRQLYKGVLDGRSRAVFNGRIVVRPEAQKTDASQTNKHLLLSDTVEVDSKPQLEIFADDVKCTHGAAEGQLAPEALYYLRTRGLSEERARALLTYGFAREVIEQVRVDPLRMYLDRALMAWLGTKERA